MNHQKRFPAIECSSLAEVKVKRVFVYEFQGKKLGKLGSIAYGNGKGANHSVEITSRGSSPAPSWTANMLLAIKQNNYIISGVRQHCHIATQ